MCSNACECTEQVPANPPLTNNAEEKTDSNKLPMCKKCHTDRPFIIMDKIHVHCKGCFIEACRKKFRATLGKSKMLTHGDKILVAYSGGQSSRMLLDLIKHSLQCSHNKQLKFTPTVLYVDMGIVLDETPQARIEKINDTLHSASQTYAPWKFLWTTIEASINAINSGLSNAEEPSFYEQYNSSQPVEPNHRLLSDELTIKHFKGLLESGCSDLTSKLELVQKFLRQSIQSVAQCELENRSNKSSSDSNFIFTGSTSSQLATNLMIDVILGQGSELQACVGFSDCREAIPALRPLRDFSKKEVAYYLLALGLDLTNKKTLSTLSERKSSIQRVTESFLNKLYVDYPATYYTLLRIGNKMQV